MSKKTDNLIKEMISYRMNYEVYFFRSDFRVAVRRTYQPADGVHVFAKFTQAKRAALQIYEDWIAEIKSRSELTSKRLTKSSVDQPFVS